VSRNVVHLARVTNDLPELRPYAASLRDDLGLGDGGHQRVFGQRELVGFHGTRLCDDRARRRILRFSTGGGRRSDA
jgi:hypothetical protein